MPCRSLPLLRLISDRRRKKSRTQPGYAQRVFVGRNSNETSTLELKDAEGRDRLVLSVTPEGQARIRFLDESGDTVQEIVP